MADAQTQEDDPNRYGMVHLDSDAYSDWQRSRDADIGSIVGMPDKQSIAGLTTGLKSAQAAKVAQDEALTREFDATAARDKAYRERAFQLEGVAANELPRPWNAEEEHKRFETNPIEGFGSVGGIFAVIASAFTKAPMENAINGMAGAINSIREGNEAGYKRAFESFKENVKLAEQRFKMQHELYEDALSLGTADMAASQAKFHNAAIRFGDRHALMLMEAGLYPELDELMTSRAKAMEQVVKTKDAIDLHTVQKTAVDSLKMNPPKTGDTVQDKMMLARQVQLIYDGGAKAGSALQQAVIRYIGDPNNAKKSSQEYIDGLVKINEQFSRTADLDRQRNDYIAQRWQAWRDAHQGEDPPAEEQAKITQEAASLGRGHAGALVGDPKNASQLKISQIKEIQEEGKPEGKWQTLNEAEHEWKRRQDEPTLTPEELHKFAQAFADTGDTSIFTNLGRGRQTGANIMAIRKEAYDIIEKRGGKPSDIQMLAAKYQALKAAERAGATQEMKMGAAAYEAGSQANLALDLSKKLPRTRIVPFNRALQAYETNTSDPDMNAFAAATNTLVNSYVRAISPTGISTDLVRRHAYDMLNTALSHEAYSKVVDVLKREMSLAVQSPNQFRKRMEKEFESESAPGAAPQPDIFQTPTMPLDTGKVIKYDKEGKRINEKHSSSSESPPVTGARKAPDGEWYIDDPKRPGKYLQVQLG